MKRLLATVILLGTASGCVDPPPADRDFREDMRDFVVKIANQARATDADFIVIPQNGQELITLDGEPDGPLAVEYAAAIDGQGREDLYYGYNDDNVATPAVDRDYLLGFLDREEAEGVEVLVADYCSTPAFIDDSYAQNAANGFISFAAHRRELDAIPPYPAAPYNENGDDVMNLSQAKNLLYMINPGNFTRDTFVAELRSTNYDILLIDAFVNETPLTATDIQMLQIKANGGRRLVIAYMSIGEAEDYRYYWQSAWTTGSPDWIENENPFFDGNFVVQYWRPEWQALILNGDSAYLNRIVAAGFDGVYLDLIDAFEYFEQ